VHLRDQRRVHGREQRQRLVEQREDVRRALHGVGAQRGQVAAGHEALARAAQHHGAHARVGADVFNGAVKRFGQRVIKSVERGGAVQAQRDDGALAFDEQRGFGGWGHENSLAVGMVGFGIGNQGFRACAGALVRGAWVFYGFFTTGFVLCPL